MAPHNSEDHKDSEAPSSLAIIVAESVLSPAAAHASPHVAPSLPSRPGQQGRQTSNHNRFAHGHTFVSAPGHGPMQPVRRTMPFGQILPQGPYPPARHYMQESSAFGANITAPTFSASRITLPGARAQFPAFGPQSSYVGPWSPVGTTGQPSNAPFSNQGNSQSVRSWGSNALAYNQPIQPSTGLAHRPNPNSWLPAVGAQHTSQTNSQIWSQNQWQPQNQGPSARPAIQLPPRAGIYQGTFQPQNQLVLASSALTHSAREGPGLSQNQVAIRPSGGQVSKAPRGFTPTDMVVNGRGWRRDPDEFEKKLGEITKLSPNYKGNPGNIQNYSNEWLEEEENCVFWIDYPHPTVLEHDITSAIRDCGKVWDLHVNREKIAELGHAAAKIVFFTLRGATRFWARYGGRPGAFLVQGRPVRVRRNRIKGAEQKNAHNTRCLRISGAPQVVNRDRVLGFLSSKLYFQIDEIIECGDDQIRVIEIRFAAHQGQASLAFMAFRNKAEFALEPTFRVVHAPDPCDEVSNL